MADVPAITGLQLEEEAATLAAELAKLRGLSVPKVVAEALRRDLECERQRIGRVRRIVELGNEIRAHMSAADRNDDEWLYDKDGLPA